MVSKLKSKKYDVIVLQEEFWTACGKSATYFNNISNIMKVIQANGQQTAKIVLDAINGCSHIWGTNQVDFEKNTLVNVTLAAEWINKTYPEKTVLVSKPGELFRNMSLSS